MNFVPGPFDLFAGPQGRVNVLGVGVHAVNMEAALRACSQIIESGGRGYVCAVDAHSIVEALREPEHMRTLNNASLTLADGMPLVWIGRIHGYRSIGRVYGPDLLLELCRLSVKRGWRHFFYGGGPGVADRLTTRLSERFPRLRVVGSCTPPFRPLTPREEAELSALVEQARPDVFWVGLGSPRQEQFMAAHCGKLCCSLMIGVGAAFDFHSGKVKEAPRWMHRTGLQWTHRLLQEPKRLGRRYLHGIPVFLWNVGLELAGLKAFRPET